MSFGASTKGVGVCSTRRERKCTHSEVDKNLTRVAYDLIGPTKADIEGNRYAYTTIDIGMNYSKLLPIPNKYPSFTAASWRQKCTGARYEENPEVPE